MRNLSLSSTHSWDLSTSCLTQLALDAEGNMIYAVSESSQGQSSVDIQIFQLRFDTGSKAKLVTTFPTTSIATCIGNQTLSIKILTEVSSLAVITSAGDIGLLSLEDDEEGALEIVGSIEAGIKSAEWNPDDSLVAVVTGDEKLLLMTNAFEVVYEGPLQSSDAGEDQQVNVGWGSKQTQFHGSLGKGAAQASPLPLDKIGQSPDDDLCPRISWRGDGAYFVVSHIDSSGPRERRTLRVYDRQGSLQNVSEPIGGLEHVLSWRPSGNLIASTQRFGFEGGGMGNSGRHDVVFFERNGLRHGEFELRESPKGNEHEGYRVKELLWSCDSSILAIWIERSEGDIVQLWTMNNYHWYLKQEVLPPTFDSPNHRFTSVSWHPESPLKLVITTQNHVIAYAFAWETYISRSRPPHDSGCVAVVDGTSLLLTPFRTQNVPPPMSSCRLDVQLDTTDAPNLLAQHRAPIYASFSSYGDILAVLHHSGDVQLWNLQTRLGSGRGKALDPVKLVEFASVPRDRGNSKLNACQITIRSAFPPGCYQVSILMSDSVSDTISTFIVDNGIATASSTHTMSTRSGRLLYSEKNLIWQSNLGEVYEVASLSNSDRRLEPIAKLPEFCFSAETISVDDDPLLVGRADSSKLFITSTASSKCHVLSSNCTSFTVADNLVIYTTASHEAFFAPAQELRALLASESNGEPSTKTMFSPQWEKRRVERGSRIVTAVPSAMSLVLQMPRGNLETINPRPLVLAVVKKDIEALNYQKAFLACRKHRIDLNILFEHNRATFLENVALFVEQVNEVDYLNLFLTNVGQSSQPPETIAEVCDAVRLQLDAKSMTTYVNSILTAYVVKKPPDYESGLSLLLRLRELQADLVEEAVKYIIFLVDADKLFDTALGMYDFSLVLLIAQHSQRDPREYLPFLRELRSLPKFYQRYKIDDYLRRYQSALANIHLAGSEYFEEGIVYVEKHNLYMEGLSIWKGEEESYIRLLELYGDWLFDRREFKQAALVYVDAKNSSKASVAYERALLWRELFTLVVEEQFDEDQLKEVAYRVADELSAKKRHVEAADVLLGYAKDVHGCIAALANGSAFSEARRLIAMHNKGELVEEILHPAALEARNQMSEDIEEMRTQLTKQALRVQELRVKQTEDPDAFYGIEDPSLHNVDVMTDISMPATAFTRYTAAPSLSSRGSKRTSRSKKKMERKIGSGKKGTIDEEEYLLTSITKLVARLTTLQGDSEQLIPHLMQFSTEHRDEAKTLQDELMIFQKEVGDALEIVWPKKDEQDGLEVGRSLDAENWVAQLETKKAQRRAAVEQITKPQLATKTWGLDVLGVL